MARGGKRSGAGRPKGAPNKNPPEVKLLAREYTEKAIETLANIMLTGESETARNQAANSLLDRGWGKPAQALTGEDGKALTFTVLTGVPRGDD